MDFYNRAYEIRDEIIRHRRLLHQIPETGMNLPKTTEYIKNALIDMGYQVEQPISSGLVVTVGNQGKTVMLRTDTDALPIKENTELDFASTNGNMHACGHDTHTAMMLGAAKILKEYENELKGTVKIVFQPGEEVFLGARAMLEAGVLENPKVDVAIMTHINSTLEPGVHVKTGIMYASSNNFRIVVRGKACHGAMPYNGVDSIIISSQIILGLQELISREVPFDKSAVLTFGSFHAGRAANAIPDEAVLEGTMRTHHTETLKHMEKRIPEVVKGIASIYRAEADFEYTATVPVGYNDEVLSNEIMGYVDELSQGQKRFKIYEALASNGSEDFAQYSQLVPSFAFRLGAPDQTAPEKFALHNSKMIIDDSQLYFGTAVHVHSAAKWLENHK